MYIMLSVVRISQLQYLWKCIEVLFSEFALFTNKSNEHTSLFNQAVAPFNSIVAMQGQLPGALY